jgi:hypothetical protein
MSVTVRFLVLLEQSRIRQTNWRRSWSRDVSWRLPSR